MRDAALYNFDCFSNDCYCKMLAPKFQNGHSLQKFYAEYSKTV